MDNLDNTIIPEIDTIKNLCEQKGLKIVKSNNLISRNMHYLSLDLNLEDFLSLMKEYNSTIILYDYSKYQEEDYLISNEMLEYEIEDFSELQKQEITERVAAYNSSIHDNNDFDKPYKLLLVGFSEHLPTFCLEFLDEWMKCKTENGETQLLYEKASDALQNLIFPSEEEYEKYEDEQRRQIIELEEHTKKRIFELLVNDIKFGRCTNASLRKQYSTSFKMHQPDVIESLKLLYARDWKKQLEYYIETIWKLRRAGYFEYSDKIKNML